MIGELTSELSAVGDAVSTVLPASPLKALGVVLLPTCFEVVDSVKQASPRTTRLISITGALLMRAERVICYIYKLIIDYVTLI